MQIQRDVDLQSCNTLAVPSRAEFFCSVTTIDDLREALSWVQKRQLPLHLLGGGSNVVLDPEIPGLMVRMDIRGREVVSQAHDHVVVRIGAGENWHQLVEWALSNGFYGLENLALIPGTVGAAPVQNIGAYGVEVSRFIERVDGVTIPEGEEISLRAEECEFAYRDSVFKNRLRSRFVITAVVLRLSRRFQAHTSYPALQDVLGEGPVTAERIFNAVFQVRRSKLPDPETIPNCGSFFKNPIVPWDLYEALAERYPGMPSYDASSNIGPARKLAAAWLIDQAGWKGKTVHGIKIHQHQALVLTNPSRLPADVVLDVASMIQMEVKAKFGVLLEMEPQRIGS